MKKYLVLAYKRKVTVNMRQRFLAETVEEAKEIVEKLDKERFAKAEILELKEVIEL